MRKRLLIYVVVLVIATFAFAAPAMADRDNDTRADQRLGLKEGSRADFRQDSGCNRFNCFNRSNRSSSVTCFNGVCSNRFGRFNQFNRFGQFNRRSGTTCFNGVCF
jgi:hypothetical protein